ncbi:hypothetical protein AVEN_185666-1 [Araneus ventricosus]|uniref:Uncharacterized protein n=1 Tax=Araneus ventricosus TaxID=182803 RepID=A0A4Y2FXG5_ARAVE|nr:hypothetical protein AVEN_185666-1 [Araneus ventricosus]
MEEHLAAEPLQQLCTQRRMKTCVVVEQSPSDYHLFQHLKSFLAKQHLYNDDEVQTDGFHRRAPLSDGRSLRHRCTEIGLMVGHALQFRWFL